MSRIPGAEAAETIQTTFLASGLPAFAVVGRDVLAELARVSDSAAVGRYGLLDSAGAVVAAFPYDPRAVYGSADGSMDGSGLPSVGDDAAGPAEAPVDSRAFLRVGAFAAWNRYAALSRLLVGAGRVLAAETSLPARGFRAIVNSRLPEKRLAVLAGLGFVGRSSLVVTDAYGPACILGALLLPPGFPVEAAALSADPARLAAGAGCGACRACADACPTGAIAGGFDTGRCIQYWTARPGEVPEPVRIAWGDRLYGCDACVAACPHSARAWTEDERGSSPAGRAADLVLPAERRPGTYVSARFFEEATDEEIRYYLRKTALGMSWIGAAELRRNARLSVARPFRASYDPGI